MNDKRGIRGIIFNVQRYSIHDGPGIRTTVFLKGCPLRCYWCQNPESQEIRPEIFLNRDSCIRCRKCVAVCPNGANSLLDGVAVMDRGRCRGCGECIEACSGGARTLIGRHASVQEIMQEVMRDKRFYDRSGGGVTLSGGDPTAQPKFALALLSTCKEAGLHTAIETCGYTSWPVMEKLLEFTDLVLYDVKCMDEGKHRAATGKSNRRILDNVAKIAACKPLRIRVPIIPGFNDSLEEVEAIAHFAKTELGCRHLDLMAYNRMGESKYERLGRPPVRIEPIDEDRMEELRNFVSACS